MLFCAVSDPCLPCGTLRPIKRASTSKPATKRFILDTLTNKQDVKTLGFTIPLLLLGGIALNAHRMAIGPRRLIE